MLGNFAKESTNTVMALGATPALSQPEARMPDNQTTAESRTRAALRRSPTAFVGLIGSATKRARFHRKLENDAIPPEARSRLTSPIGVAGVTGKEPDVIAIATLAQLLQLRAA